MNGPICTIRNGKEKRWFIQFVSSREQEILERCFPGFSSEFHEEERVCENGEKRMLWPVSYPQAEEVLRKADSDCFIAVLYVQEGNSPPRQWISPEERTIPRERRLKSRKKGEEAHEN